MDATGVPKKIHWPAASHWQTLTHNVLSSTPRLGGIELNILVEIGTDTIDSYKSNYHTNMTTTDNSVMCILQASGVRGVRPPKIRKAYVIQR